MSSYVESIKREDLDFYARAGKKTDEETVREKYFQYMKTVEYWPEIAGAYFNDRAKFQKDHTADYALVKKRIDLQASR